MTSRRDVLTLGAQTAFVCANLGLTRVAHAELDADAPSQQLRAFLRTPRLVGQQRLTYWGFDIYDASLWASTPFAPEAWAKQNLVLRLRYLRDFKGTDIAQRSIDEMQGQRPLTPAQLKSWSATLQSLIPNVRNGESITGVYQPDKGLQLLHQDRLLGELNDTELAQRFLGIWLAPETSQRQLRQQLLARAQL
jgi:hypothetical protein